MPDSKRFLHPEAIQRISRLDVRARHIVEGFLSGVHRSPYFGQSVEFLQHREYCYGDDLRRIDWKVWAKQDKYYVKQYEEEIVKLRTVMQDRVTEQQAVVKSCNDKKLEIQKVLEFFPRVVALIECFEGIAVRFQLVIKGGVVGGELSALPVQRCMEFAFMKHELLPALLPS